MTTVTGRRYRTRVYNEIDALAEARGRADGVARSVLALLQKRGIAVPDEARARILACRDGAEADVWLDRAFTATTVEEVLRAD